METNKFTRISVEVYGERKIAVEFPKACVSVNDMCQAFRTIMVGMTITDETAGEIIASYLEEYYGNRYKIVNIEE